MLAAVTPANSSTVIHVAPTVLTMLSGVVIPLLVSLATKLSAPKVLKAILSALLSAVAGAVATATAAGGAVNNWEQYVFTILLGTLTATGMYLGVWKPAGVIESIEATTGHIGLRGCWLERLFRRHKPKPAPAPPVPPSSPVPAVPVTPITGGVPVTNIAVINQSTVVNDADVAAYIPTMQQQITQDFAPVWGAEATLRFVPKGQAVDPTWWQAVLLDNSDQAGALGYHDLTSSGQPLAKIFAGSDKQYGYDWRITLGHELLEMLGDPLIDTCVMDTDDQGNVTIYAYEACDACEDDKLAYQINGVPVTDFVYPSWFTVGEPGPYDKAGHITKPLQLLPGGYIGVWTSTGGWTQRTAEETPDEQFPRTRAQVGSRRERRRVGRHSWVHSTI